VPNGDVQCQTCRGFFVVLEPPDDDERRGLGVQQAPASSSVDRCPHNHDLGIVQLCAPHYCDVCNNELQPGTLVKQCAQCDFDICGQCEHDPSARARSAGLAGGGISRTNLLSRGLGSFMQSFVESMAESINDEGNTDRSTRPPTIFNHFTRSFELGLDTMINTEGLTEQERETLRSISAGGRMREGISSLVNHFMEQTLGASWEDADSGVDGGRLKSFLESHTCPAPEGQEGNPWLCPICTEVAGENNPQIVEICTGHYFHLACLSEWLKRKDSCPLCRREPIVDSSAHGSTQGCR